MRELKFRAWDTAKKEWIAKDFDIMGEVMMSGQLFDRRVEEFNDVEVMQYTGLKDKNGKEIYEGDIIGFDEKEWGGKDNIHIVSWDDKDGSWSWGGGVTSDMEWREVIGNIYENPGLLP
jgi:uncharacterized phage protein (TIGR01671 family)